jgi:Protein of unknown function (DUF2958)
MGFPELGSVSIAELESARGAFNLCIECDLNFSPAKVISAYAADACTLRRINA